MRLSRAALAQVPAGVETPGDRSAVTVGVIHFGPGAFHRAHQAAYFDSVLATDPRWGIAAVAMRSRGTVAALAEQEGLYTIAIRDAAPAYRIVDAHRRFLGPDDAADTHALLADPAIGIVTTTVTEKGYCLAADGSLDLGHPDIVRDLAGGPVPASVIGWLVAGLAARHKADTPPFVVLPCDNVADNGAKVRAALITFAARTDQSLSDWIAQEVDVRSTMVDSITPAGDEQLARDVEAALGGVVDQAPVQREAFTQWVIEDNGRPLGPDLAAVGATLTPDVAGYERAKLRILNGSHSTLAYAGQLRGHATVAEAMGDDALAGFVAAMIERDIAPVLPVVPGLDLAAYREAVLARFRNPGIVHRLEQIAQDGSQKLPNRMGGTIAAHRSAGRMPGHVVAAMGCWVAFLIDRARNGTDIVDPAGKRLAEIAAIGDPSAVTEALANERLGFTPDAKDDRELIAAIAASAEQALCGDWSALFGG